MDASQRIDLSPSCSLTPHGALVFFGMVCLGSFGVAGMLTLMGYWPILPFAGLEMLALGWALKASLGRRHYREIITVSDSEVRISTWDRSKKSEVVFPRHWAQVKLHHPVSRLHPSRLIVESHGRWCEIGGFLTDEERRGLGNRLTRLIGRINESPSLV